MIRHMQQRRAERGVAMIEAMIMLPFFIIIYFGIHYWGELQIKRSEAQQRARACAWEYSNTGCDNNDLPDSCQEQGALTFKDGQPDHHAEPDCQAVLAQSGEPTTAEDATKRGMCEKKDQLKSDNGMIMDWVTDHLMDALSALSGEKVTKTAIIAMQTPAFIAQPSESPAQGSYRLTCNIRPTTLRDFFGDIWEKISPF